MARRQSRFNPPPPASPAGADGAEIASRLHEIERQIRALAHAQCGAGAPPGDAAEAAGGGPLTQRLSAVTGQPRAPAAPGPGETEQLARIARQLHELSGRMELSEQRNADALESIQERVCELGAAAAGSEHPRMQSAGATLADVKNRLAALCAGTSQDPPGEPPERPARTNRVSLPPETDMLSAGGPETDEDFQHLGRRLQQIRAHAGTRTARQHESDADVAALSADLRALCEDVAQLRRDAIGQGELDSLRADIVGLSQRIEENDPWSRPDNPLANIEARIDDLAQQVEHALSANDLSPHIAELERRVGEIAEQMSAASQARNDSTEYDALEQQIALLAGRLETAEQGFSSLQQIEANVARLFADMEGNREFATRTAQEAVANAVALVDRGAGDGPLPEDTLELLQAGLKSVEENARQADMRTQKTLEAVHDTLKTVIERLSALEEGAIGAARGEDAPRAASDPAAGTGSAEIDSLRLPPVETARSDTETADPETAPVPSAGDIRPGAEDMSRNDEPTDRGAANRVTRSQDFIAAARRAARAGSGTDSEDKSARGGLVARAQKLRRTRKRSPTADGSTQPTGKKKPGAQRRTLLMAAVVLLMIGTASTYSLLGSKGDKSVPGEAKPATAGKTADPASAAPPDEAGKAPSPATEPVATISVPKTKNPDIESAPGEAGGGQGAARTAPDPMLPADIETYRPAAPAGQTSMAAPWRGAARSVPAPVYIGDNPVAVPESAALGKSDRAAPGDDDITTASIRRPSPLAASMPPAAVGPQSLRRAAVGGDPIAQFEVAGRYIEGKAVAQDFSEAARWYQRAAAQGLAPAQYRLGTLYEKGHGVPRDAASARIWYKRAAEKGNHKAMHNLAVIYTQNSAGKPDFARAAAWFRRAAEHGLTDSQYNLGILHERGYGVKADPAEAYKWFSLAARNGDKDAAARRDRLEKTMNPKTLAAARLSVSAWEPKSLNESANTVTLPIASWRAAPAAGKSAAAGTSSTLKEVQSRLNALGYAAGPADGIIGRKTRSAIRLFQKRNGMAINGTVTPKLLARLRAASG